MPDLKKSPRLQVIDTGMLSFFAGVQKDIFTSQDLTAVFSGRIIEHVVGQELIANNQDLLRNLLFWVREKEGTTSELDFLFVDDGGAIPIEVKSGKSGTLRSLHQYIDMTDTRLAIRLYGSPFQVDELKTPRGNPFTLLNIPYYMAGKLKSYATYYRSLI